MRKWVLLLYRQDSGRSEVLSACAIDKLAGEVSDEFALIELTHATAVGDIRYMGIFDIVKVAIVLHLGTVFSFDDYCHTLL